MINHFENLWEECEKKFDQTSSLDLVKHLELKINLMKTILDKKSSINKEEYEKAIEMVFGEVLFSLTFISMAENINSFKALLNALKSKD